jgi:hypothetical protein
MVCCDRMFASFRGLEMGGPRMGSHGLIFAIIFLAVGVVGDLRLNNAPCMQSAYFDFIDTRLVGLENGTTLMKEWGEPISFRLLS